MSGQSSLEESKSHWLVLPRLVWGGWLVPVTGTEYVVISCFRDSLTFTGSDALLPEIWENVFRAPESPSASRMISEN